MRNLKEDEFVRRYLVELPDRLERDVVTSMVFDAEAFAVVWFHLRRLTPTDAAGNPVDPIVLARLRQAGRVPFVLRSPETDELFAKLGVETDAFCGHLRGAVNPRRTGEQSSHHQR